MRTFKNLFFLISTILICSCSSERTSSEEATSSSIKKSSKDFLLLTKIDNKVMVYVNDSVIFTSPKIESSPDLSFNVDLSSFISSPSDEIKLELYNGNEPYIDQEDPLWEVRYELTINNEIVDYRNESGKNNKIGLVFQKIYKVSEWE